MTIGGFAVFNSQTEGDLPSLQSEQLFFYSVVFFLRDCVAVKKLFILFEGLCSVLTVSRSIMCCVLPGRDGAEEIDFVLHQNDGDNGIEDHQNQVECCHIRVVKILGFCKNVDFLAVFIDPIDLIERNEYTKQELRGRIIAGLKKQYFQCLQKILRRRKRLLRMTLRDFFDTLRVHPPDAPFYYNLLT